METIFKILKASCIAYYNTDVTEEEHSEAV